MTDHVPTQETCEKMKDAGFPQNTYLEYWNDNHGQPMIWNPTEVSDYETGIQTRLCAAPTLTEILEQLPFEINLNRAVSMSEPHDVVWRCEYGYSPKEPLGKHHANPAEAAALLWLKLKELDA